MTNWYIGFLSLLIMYILTHYRKTKFRFLFTVNYSYLSAHTLMLTTIYISKYGYITKKKQLDPWPKVQCIENQKTLVSRRNEIESLSWSHELYIQYVLVFSSVKKMKKLRFFFIVKLRYPPDNMNCSSVLLRSSCHQQFTSPNMRYYQKAAFRPLSYSTMYRKPINISE